LLTSQPGVCVTLAIGFGLGSALQLLGLVEDIQADQVSPARLIPLILGVALLVWSGLSAVWAYRARRRERADGNASSENLT
jgi:hypothetical protein